MNGFDHEIGCLLEICRRGGDGFTLEHIVSCVIAEHPAEICQFALAWEEMHRRRLVQLRKCGRPTVYEIVHEAQAQFGDSTGCSPSAPLLPQACAEAFMSDHSGARQYPP